jgi:regulator of replication initiation timing
VQVYQLNTTILKYKQTVHTSKQELASVMEENTKLTTEILQG